jgi:uncharacterized protein (DUF697 family)
MGYLGAVGPAYDPTRATVPQLDAERFSGNNSAVAFTLSRQVVSPTDVDVIVENVRQEPIVAYSIVNGSTLTFTEAPQTGTNNIYVIYRGSGVSNYAFVPDGSISYAKLANNIRQFNVDNFTANGTGQTFTLSETPATANTVMVAIDGVIQTAPSNYSISGTTLTFTSAPATSANVTVRHLGFRTTSTVTALSAGSVTATEIVDGAVTNAKLAGSITSDKISTVSGTSLIANTIPSNTVSGNVIVANTVSNSAFSTGSIENYLRANTLDFGMRNRIINGAMRIDQRNNGAAVTGNDNVYGVDRFRVQVTQSAKMDLQQDSSANTVAGFTSSLKVTSSSAYSVTSSDYFFLQQRIEGNNVADLRWGTANARPVTLSFWVRSSLTGTFGGSLQNDDQNRNYPFTYTINSANTWEYETITVPGDTTGTWLTNNGTGLRVNFGLGVGSNFSGTAGAWNANSNNLSATGAVSVVGTNAATWYVTGVQLEEGSVPTSFDYRQYGTELALCQRYYKRISRVDSSGGDNGIINLVDWNGTDSYSGNIISPSMRSAPSLSYSALSDFTYYEAGSTKTPTGITIVGSGPNHAEISVGWSGGLTAGRAGWMRINGSSGWIAFSSEI